LEAIGYLLCWLGFCFALLFVVVCCSEKRLAKEKHEFVIGVAEMKTALIAAKVPEEQIPGLLRVHKSALANHIAHMHFIVLSFFVLLSLWVALLGLVLQLWGKLRALPHAERSKGEETSVA
jgi:hypothetical protein